MTDTEPAVDPAAGADAPSTGAPVRPDTEEAAVRGPGLGTRLFFAAALLISITLGLVLFFSTWEADRQARREIRESLQAVPQIYEGYVASQAQSRRAQVQTLAEGVGLKALLGGGADTATYHDTATELARGVGAGAVFLFDRRGVLLARSDRESGEEAGRDFSLVRWVGEPLANGKTTSAFILEIRRAHHLSLIAAAAVSQGNGTEQQIVGVVAAAFPWESSAAIDLQRLLTGEIAFLGNVAARGKPPGPAVFGASPGFADATDLMTGLTADPAFIDTLFAQAKMRQAFDFRSGGERYIGTALPILSGGGEPIAALVVGRSEATALAVFRRIREAILLVGAAILLLALPISFAVARRISRPVEQLAAAAEEVRLGRLDVALPSERTDEVGRLARAFGAMVAELREKQTLEKLVATLRAGSGQATPDRTAPSASAPAPGQVFAHRYQTLDVLGEGGMGRVFRVLDLELDEIVALKVLGGSNIAERTRGEQFLRHELKVARAITHPNVVRVHDLGEVDGDRFLTMEYVSGTSLRRLLDQKRRLDVVPALQIAKQICRGLQAVHGAGIVHGDLKPENVMVMPDGTVKLMDFGVATNAASRGEEPALVALGTPRYMSPEHVRGAELEERSDLYSLGVLMFEVLAGQVPFDAEDPQALMRMHLYSTPPALREIRPDLTPVLVDILGRCMAKSRQDRPASAAELERSLMRVRR